MKKIILPEVSSRYGAPMGRFNSVEEPDEPIKFRLHKMLMVDGCYDTGGAYWGAGDHRIGYMYHAIGEGPEYVNEVFIRAVSREDAKGQVKEIFEFARFYR